MYMAMLLICATVEAESCTNLINTNEFHTSEEACVQDYQVVADMYVARGAYYVRGTCVQIGKAT